jgi:hypothetical protein
MMTMHKVRRVVPPVHLIREPEPGYAPTDQTREDDYAARLSAQADAWYRFASERSHMPPERVRLKAFSSLATSFRHRTRSLAIPTTLHGSSSHQQALWELVRRDVPFGQSLRTEEQGGDLHVYLEDLKLGHVKSKHVPWLRPLVPFGARLFLIRVTGQQEDFTLGCNVLIGHVGVAVEAIRHALGQTCGDGEASPHIPGGDGQSGGEADLAPARRSALPRRTTDIRLWRTYDGAGHANVPQVTYYSSTGFEWGYGGAGPAELALSILSCFVEPHEAHLMHGDFKDEILEPMDWEGGTISAGFVRAWIQAKRIERGAYEAEPLP